MFDDVAIGARVAQIPYFRGKTSAESPTGSSERARLDLENDAFPVKQRSSPSPYGSIPSCLPRIPYPSSHLLWQSQVGSGSLRTYEKTCYAGYQGVCLVLVGVYEPFRASDEIAHAIHALKSVQQSTVRRMRSLTLICKMDAFPGSNTSFGLSSARGQNTMFAVPVNIRHGCASPERRCPEFNDEDLLPAYGNVMCSRRNAMC